MRGKTQIPMKQVVAGDIGVTTKLQFTATGDTLSDKNSPVLFKPIAFPLPMYTRAIYAKKKGEEEKIASALNRLMDEDPTIIVTRNTATKETLISGIEPPDGRGPDDYRYQKHRYQGNLNQRHGRPAY